MPTVPYAQLQISVNGGAYQTGGIDTSVADVLTLRFVDTTGITAQLFEIYDYPSGFACPAGWSTDADGVYYYDTDFLPPTVTITRWGKLMFRLTGNNGIKDGLNNPTDMVDKETASRTASTAGFHSVGEFESDQFATSWVEEYKHDMDLAAAGGLSAPANPGDNYKICYALNGALAWTDEIKTNAAETALEIGATVATAGHIRLEAQPSIYCVDSAAADLRLLSVNAGDDLLIGDAANVDDLYLDALLSNNARIGGTVVFRSDNNGIQVKPAGANVASAGMVRLPEDATIVGLNATPVDATMIALVNNDLVVGDSAQVATVYEKATTSIVSQIGVNAELTVAAGYLSHSPGAATVSTTGTHRVHSDFALKARADDDDGDISLIALSGTSANDLSIGEVTDIANTHLKALTTIDATIGATKEFTVAAGYVAVSPAGCAVSATGTIRGGSTVDIAGLIAAGGTDANVVYWAGDTLLLGDATRSDSTTVASNTAVISRVGANTEFKVRGGWVEMSPGGAIVSSTGTHCVSAAYALKARNHDNDGDLNLLSLSDTSANDMTLGEVTDIATLNLKATNYITFTLSGPQSIAEFKSTGLTFTNTLAMPTIDVDAYGDHAGTGLTVQAGDCNYGFQPGDLYLKSGANGGGGAAVSVHIIASGDTIYQAATDDGTNKHAWFGGALAVKQDVVGARDTPEAALANLLTALANYGLITNSTTAS